MDRSMKLLAFDTMLGKLAKWAQSEQAKRKALSLTPTMKEHECKARMEETSDARRVLESFGSPPLSAMEGVEEALRLAEIGAMLAPETLSQVRIFVASCQRAKSYLKRAEALGGSIAFYGQNLYALADLHEEIDRCIQNDGVSDYASPELRAIRRSMESKRDAIRSKLESMLRGHKEWFSEQFIVTRGGRLVLPVKKEHKQQVQGTVVDQSSTGGTVFIEPTQARKLTDELALLAVDEDNEVRRVLYTLTVLVDACRAELKQNMACMETLDFAFAKAKLSVEMNACAPEIGAARNIRIVQGRHPLLPVESCVPLDFAIGGGIRGVVITGPNTGGKTVALKTVGLLSLMAQSGLHVPVASGSTFSMCANVLCDIGDGQSITENLSTFSSHMTNIISILQETTHESLVLLDELGSGTDPAEGMGLAVAILEELRQRNCLFVATSHYPEIKEYAARTDGLTNARMAFDRESLRPLYALEMGEAGESCAFHIAQRLGFPEHLLAHARTVTSHARGDKPAESLAELPSLPKPMRAPSRIRKEEAPEVPRRCDAFQIGDSVRVYPQKDIGIVCRRADEMGMLGVQVKEKKLLVNHKRVKLIVSAMELYPDDYDFSIVFDTVENRKARHQQTKGHRPEAVIRYENADLFETGDEANAPH